MTAISSGKPPKRHKFKLLLGCSSARSMRSSSRATISSVDFPLPPASIYSLCDLIAAIVSFILPVSSKV
jgi:hypothetical protein